MAVQPNKKACGLLACILLSRVVQFQSPLHSAMAVPQIFKRARCNTVKYEFWPSDLQRAGHTSVSVQSDEPLGEHLAKTGRHEVYGIHMARMQKLPCKLVPTSKFRNGAERWWCPIHQGSYGKKAQVLKAGKTGVKCCDHSDALVDFVRSEEVLDLRLGGFPKLGGTISWVVIIVITIVTNNTHHNNEDHTKNNDSKDYCIVGPEAGSTRRGAGSQRLC